MPDMFEYIKKKKNRMTQNGIIWFRLGFSGRVYKLFLLPKSANSPKSALVPCSFQHVWTDSIVSGNCSQNRVIEKESIRKSAKS